MSFSAWFSALGRPFFLPSVLSLVAFPANRHSARHPLPQPQAARPGVQIPLGKGIAASPQLGAQPEYLQAPVREMAVPSFSCLFVFLTLLLLFAKRSSCSTAGACFGKPHFHWGRKKAFLSKGNLFGAGAPGQLLSTEIPRTFCQGILQMETWPHKTQHSLLGASSWAFLPRLLTLLFQESIFRHGICLLGRFPGTPKTCSGSSPSPETWQPAHTPTRLRRALAGAECFLPHLQLSLCWPLGFCRFFTCSLGCSPTRRGGEHTQPPRPPRRVPASPAWPQAAFPGGLQRAANLSNLLLSLFPSCCLLPLGSGSVRGASTVGAARRPVPPSCSDSPA